MLEMNLATIVAPANVGEAIKSIDRKCSEVSARQKDIISDRSVHREDSKDFRSILENEKKDRQTHDKQPPDEEPIRENPVNDSQPVSVEGTPENKTANEPSQQNSDIAKTPEQENENKNVSEGNKVQTKMFDSNAGVEKSVNLPEDKPNVIAQGPVLDGKQMQDSTQTDSETRVTDSLIKDNNTTPKIAASDVEGSNMSDKTQMHPVKAPTPEPALEKAAGNVNNVSQTGLNPNADQKSVTEYKQAAEILNAPKNEAKPQLANPNQAANQQPNKENPNLETNNPDPNAQKELANGNSSAKTQSEKFDPSTLAEKVEDIAKKKDNREIVESYQAQIKSSPEHKLNVHTDDSVSEKALTANNAPTVESVRPQSSQVSNTTAPTAGINAANGQGIEATAQNQRMTPAEQILTAVNSMRDMTSSQITLQLNPAHLGAIKIRFEQANGEITGLIEARNPQTQKEIEKALPELSASLQNQGVALRRIQVQPPAQQQQNGQEKNQQQQEYDGQLHREFQNESNSNQHRNSSSSDHQQGNFSQRQPFANGSDFQRAQKYSVTAADQKSLNLYI